MTDDTAATRADAVRALEGEFGELVAQFRRQYLVIADRVSPGMLPGPLRMLTTIERKGPVTASALSECLAVDKGLTSRTARELESLGLISRTPDPGDGRSSLLRLTPLGEERLAAARAPEENRLHRALEAWSVDDIRQLSVLLHALSSGEAPGPVGAAGPAGE